MNVTGAIGTAVVKNRVNNAMNSASNAVSGQSKATGYLGPYCPKTCCLGISTANTVRLSLLFSMMFFLFIAMCVPSLKEFKLDGVASVDCKCTHTQKLVCEGDGSSSVKFKDLSDELAILICDSGASDGRDKNFSGAQAFIGCTAWAWLCMLVNIPVLIAIDKPFWPLADYHQYIYYINGALGVWIWIFLTANWGSWNDQNCCGTTSFTKDVKAGASWSLAVFVWILDLFYLTFCIPDVEEILFGEK